MKRKNLAFNLFLKIYYMLDFLLSESNNTNDKEVPALCVLNELKHLFFVEKIITST
jgi:hypothetical protein